MSAGWTPRGVAEAGFCIGCGLCQARLGAGRLRLEEGAGGLPVPAEEIALSPEEAEAFGIYCPGARMSAPGPAPGVPRDPVWGNLRAAQVVHAADPATRHRSASGGALTALCRHLLASGEVGFVQHVRPDPGRALHSVAARSETWDELAAASGSRYAPTSPLAAFQEALEDGRPFAFVGRPCDVMAVRQLARVDPAVGERCRYLLTFLCGGTSEYAITTRQLDEWGLCEADLAAFSWRGNGCPGPVTARLRDGTERRTTYFALYGADESAWGLFLRCKLCADAIGLSADIVAGDFWPGGAPRADDAGDPLEEPGINVAVARTAAGMRLLEAAVASGHLVADDGAVTADRLDDAQPHQTSKRRALAARFEGIARVAPVPELEAGLDLAEASIPPGPDYDRQADGAARRYLRR